MNILGVHIGHDSSVALVQNGKIVADVAEERFVRIKHYSGIPYNALSYCLNVGGISMEGVDFIAVSSSGPVPLLNFLFEFDNKQVERPTLRAAAADVYRKYFGGNQRKPPLYMPRYRVSKRTRIIHVGHHLAHAATAYFTSGLSLAERTLIVTCDGAGDGASMCLWRGQDGAIEPLRKFGTSGSLGWFYSNVTEALGWVHGDGEGKTMGLAPYGDYSKCRGVLDRFYPKYSAGDLVQPYDFGVGFYWNESGAMEFHFDDADKIAKLVERHGREHIAAEAQRVLEEQVMEVVLPWLAKEKTSKLCSSGGVFLNVKLNQRIWYSGKALTHWTFPNCGDSGLALGSALFAQHQLNPRLPIARLEHLYWGPEFSEQEVADILRSRNLQWKRVDDIETHVARLLADNKIVAWFQGRMESGPRALGNRSILMNTGRHENKDIINARVKFREGFRPFCPSMPVEAGEVYLEKWRPEPFMITSFDTMESKKLRIPAVVHADGTARPQTVEKGINPRYWRLLNEFGSITGDPVLLNTSLNIKGEPMICHPREAIRCFFDSGLDYLAIGDLLISK